VAEATLMHRLVSGEIPRPSEQAQVDPELEELIVKATAPNAEDRFATAEQLRLELDGYIARAGEHCSPRQIGAELAQVFAAERRRNTELINVALRDSVRPAPQMLEVPTAVSEAPAPSRAPLFAIGALVLLAIAGFLAPKIWSVPPSTTPDARLTVPATPALVPTRPAVAVSPVPAPSPEAAPPPAESATEGVVAPSGAAPSASAAAGSANEKKRAPAVRPTPAAAPAAAPAKPAAEDRCSPPYYFVAGIKTYKPECL
ncbi:MAG TPA: hypothetical protein VEQ59_05075, partial [Polyangiaceae bacterium]|nr:hypothetical protein [Polyangiaceae bacterium]